MATTIKMPQLGESVTEGTIERWLVKEGDKVDQYDPLFEVVTDKVNAEVPAEVAGTVTKIIVGDGQTVKVGTPLAEIETDGATAEAPATAPPTAAATPAAGAPPAAAAAAPEQAAAPEAVIAPEPEPAPDPEPTPEPEPEPAPEPPGPVPTPEPVAAPGPEGTPAPVSAAAPTAAPAAPAAAPAAPAAAPAAERDADSAAERDADSAGNGSMRMTPAVRRLVREHSIDVSQLTGSGAGGRVTRDDVLAFVAQGATAAPAAPIPPATAENPVPAALVEAPTEAPTEAPPAPAPAAPAPAAATPAPTAEAPAAPPAAAAAPTPAPTAAAAATPAYAAPAQLAAPTGGDVEVPLTQMRKGIAAKMTRVKQTVPHAYTVVEVDMHNVVRWRETNQDSYKAREGVGISYVAAVIKAVTETLRQHPTLNSQFAEDRIVLKQAMNIGIAVAVDNGLLVPVIANADQLSISGVNHRIQDLAARARTNKLRLDEIQGGTFTVNNTGWFGSVSSMPIINTPEVAILSMEAIVKRPVVVTVEGEDVITIRPMMNMTCSFDHRVLDGAQVGNFLADVRKRLEAWDPATPIG